MRGAVLQALPTLALVSLLAVILLLLVPVLNRRAAAGVRCLIWGALLLRLLLPFSLYAPIQVDVEVPANSRLLPLEEDSAGISGVAGSQEEEAAEPSGRAFPWGLLLWGAGAAMFWGWHAGVMLRFRRRAERMRRPWPPEWPQPESMSARVSAGVTGPVLVGWRRPRLYLPAEGWDGEALEWIYAHEDRHRRSGDILIKYGLLLVRGLLWFHPVVHWLAFQLRRDLELRCDEAVLKNLEAGQRLAYGETLLRMAGRGRGLPFPAAGFLGRRSLMRERIEEVLREGRRRRGTWLLLPVAAMLLGISLVAVMPVAAALPLPLPPVSLQPGSPGEGETAQPESIRLSWPVPAHRHITASYGYRWGTLHGGIDIAGGDAPVMGERVVAAADGVVAEAGYSPEEGNYLWLDHGGGWRTFYAHLQETEAAVGTRVKQGEGIARAGNTGRVSGPHLHFGLYHQGKACDPLPYLIG